MRNATLRRVKLERNKLITMWITSGDTTQYFDSLKNRRASHTFLTGAGSRHNSEVQYITRLAPLFLAVNMFCSLEDYVVILYLTIQTWRKILTTEEVPLASSETDQRSERPSHDDLEKTTTYCAPSRRHYGGEFENYLQQMNFSLIFSKLLFFLYFR